MSITVLLGYGSVLGYQHLTSLLTQRFAPASLLKGSSSAKASQLLWRKRFTWSQLLNAYIWAFTRVPTVGATTLLTIMCTPLGGGFLVYHIYLLWIGATTNETQKWSDWREDIDDGLVFRARIDVLRRGREGYKALPEHVEPRSEYVNWPPKEIPRWLWRPKAAPAKDTGGREGEKERYRPEYWYIQTRNGDPPTFKLPNGQISDDTRWERVWSLRKEVENVYDLGFMGNLWDIVFHRERK